MRDARNPSLVRELCRIFNAGERAMLCAMSHAQVTVDGYTMLPSFDRRWPRDRMEGRMAELLGRQARIFR